MASAEKALQLVQSDGMLLANLSEELRQQRDIVSAAVANCAYALEFAGTDELRNDEELCSLAVQAFARHGGHVFRLYDVLPPEFVDAVRAFGREKGLVNEDNIGLPFVELHAAYLESRAEE
eukprot:scaffold954_cov221-Pinguiococcus_pyrenoidosus.AAC.3